MFDTPALLTAGSLLPLTQSINVEYSVMWSINVKYYNIVILLHAAPILVTIVYSS
jgi:hypothetical protein